MFVGVNRNGGGEGGGMALEWNGDRSPRAHEPTGSRIAFARVLC